MTRKEFETRLFDKVRENERIIGEIKVLFGNDDDTGSPKYDQYKAEGFNDGIEFVLELLGKVDEV